MFPTHPPQGFCILKEEKDSWSPFANLSFLSNLWMLTSECRFYKQGHRVPQHGPMTAHELIWKSNVEQDAQSDKLIRIFLAGDFHTDFSQYLRKPTPFLCLQVLFLYKYTETSHLGSNSCFFPTQIHPFFFPNSTHPIGTLPRPLKCAPVSNSTTSQLPDQKCQGKLWFLLSFHTKLGESLLAGMGRMSLGDQG